MTDATAKTTTLEYDADGNLFRTTDPAGVASRRYHNALGWVTSTRDAANTEWTFTYDAWGMPRFSFGPHGIASSRQYGSEGQLTAVVDEGMGRRTDVTVDDARQTVAVINGRGKTRTYARSGAAIFRGKAHPNPSPA